MTTSKQYVSRGGLKLAAALEAFEVDVTDRVCADLGCNVGGFTDCLLQAGASKVYAVDTGYGTLDWGLRQDDRVIVMERVNAMHLAADRAKRQSGASPLAEPLAASLVVIDLGWTRQVRAIEAAKQWSPQWVMTLIKPHYEWDQAIDGPLDQSVALPPNAIETGDGDGKKNGKKDSKKRRPAKRREAKIKLSSEQARRVTDRVVGEMSQWGVRVAGLIESPICGGASKGHIGNIEYLALLEMGDASA